MLALTDCCLELKGIFSYMYEKYVKSTCHCFNKKFPLRWFWVPQCRNMRFYIHLFFHLFIHSHWYINICIILSSTFSNLTGQVVFQVLLFCQQYEYRDLSLRSFNTVSQCSDIITRGGGKGLSLWVSWPYRPPGPLGNFMEELDVLLSTFHEDDIPLVILGDFNIHLDKPQAADFHTLLTSFDLKRVSTTATHKSDNQLDLIYTWHCSTDHVLVTPLHTSDHFLLTLKLSMIPDTTHTPPHVTFRRNLRSLSPSRLLLWFHLRFLPLNSYHLLMLTVLLILSAPLWRL